MTSLVSRGPVAGMSTPGWESVLTPVSYVTRGKTRISTRTTVFFSKPCGYFFSQGKKHSSSDPRTRDRYGDPMHTLK